jgi:hypothetical protein
MKRRRRTTFKAAVPTAHAPQPLTPTYAQSHQPSLDDKTMYPFQYHVTAPLLEYINSKDFRYRAFIELMYLSIVFYTARFI